LGKPTELTLGDNHEDEYESLSDINREDGYEGSERHPEPRFQSHAQLQSIRTRSQSQVRRSRSQTRVQTRSRSRVQRQPVHSTQRQSQIQRRSRSQSRTTVSSRSSSSSTRHDAITRYLKLEDLPHELKLASRVSFYLSIFRFC